MDRYRRAILLGVLVGVGSVGVFFFLSGCRGQSAVEVTAPPASSTLVASMVIDRMMIVPDPGGVTFLVTYQLQVENRLPFRRTRADGSTWEDYWAHVYVRSSGGSCRNQTFLANTNERLPDPQRGTLRMRASADLLHGCADEYMVEFFGITNDASQLTLANTGWRKLAL